ncbi:hypothetical protein [Nonomuraea sp. NPDC049158]|uniref:hypothetical protein n=1 Tax=Nonomuraea sp. NPDC049158 TaxID=3155649 RepID=UPI0034071D13
MAIRDRLKGLTPRDEQVLRLVGAHLGALASRDLAARCRAGLEHSSQAWAVSSMAQESGIAIIAVDPAHTSKWGAQLWQQPLTSNNRKTSRHDAASIAIGRRAQGHAIRRRTTPPRDDQSDRRGHRSVQAEPGALGREGPRPHPRSTDTIRAARTQPQRGQPARPPPFGARG